MRFECLTSAITPSEFASTEWARYIDCVLVRSVPACGEDDGSLSGAVSGSDRMRRISDEDSETPRSCPKRRATATAAASEFPLPIGNEETYERAAIVNRLLMIEHEKDAE